MKSYILFLRILFFPRPDSHDRLIREDLYNKFSYRVPSNLESSWISVFIYLRLTAKLIWIAKKPSNIKPNDRVVCDFNQRYESDLRNYLDSVSYSYDSFIYRDTLNNGYHWLNRLLLTFITVFIFLLLLPKFIVTAKRGRIAIIPLELFEAQLFLWNLKGAKEVIVFSPYEKDISFSSTLLMNSGIKVILIPSCNPIRFFYKHVICDVFVLTAPFQGKEVEVFKNNWIYKELWYWKPFDWYKIPVNNHAPPRYDVGIISSASYLRKQMNLANHIAEADYLAEEKMLQAMATIIKELNLKVLIYLHPKEKMNKETFNQASQYYQALLGPSIQILEAQLKTSDHFGLCNVAISGFSTAQIERLFAGYKCIFTPMGYLKNYFNDNRLDAIAANSENELKALIKEVMDIDTEDYFIKFNLKTFRYKNYHE